MSDTETFPSDSGGVRAAARALVESGKSLPAAGDATTSIATDGAVLRSYTEGRLGPDGDDLGVSVRAAAKALADERKEANALLEQMEEPSKAIVEQAKGQIELAQLAVAEMERDPAAAEAVARQIEDAAAQQRAENDRLQQLTQEVQQLQSERAHGEAVGQAVATMQSQVLDAARAEGYLASLHNAMIAGLQARFPEFRGRDVASTVAALHAADPVKALQFKNEFDLADAQFTKEQRRVGQLMQQAQLLQQQASQQSLAQWQQWGAGEDQKFNQIIGGEADPQLKKDALDLLVNVLGIPPESINELWNSPVGFPLRDHRAQAIIAMAAKYARGEAMKAEMKPARPVPPVVQRPGVARSREDYAEAEVAGLRNKALETGSLRDWARVRGEQLRQQRRRGT